MKPHTVRILAVCLQIISSCEATRSVRYVEYRPPVLDPEVGGEGVTLQARQNYEISCHGHKPLTWLVPGLNNNSDRQKRSVRGVKKVLLIPLSLISRHNSPHIN